MKISLTTRSQKRFLKNTGPSVVKKRLAQTTSTNIQKKIQKKPPKVASNGMVVKAKRTYRKRSTFESKINIYIPYLPPACKLSPIFRCESACRDYLLHEKIITIPSECPECGACQKWLMPEKRRKETTTSPFYYQCYKQGCNGGRRWQKSLLVGTFFGKCNVKKNEILQFLYMWLAGKPKAVILNEVGWTNATFKSFASYARILVSAMVGRDSKREIPTRSHAKPNRQDALYEAIWRLENQDRLWDALLDALRDVSVVRNFGET